MVLAWRGNNARGTKPMQAEAWDAGPKYNQSGFDEKEDCRRRIPQVTLDPFVLELVALMPFPPDADAQTIRHDRPNDYRPEAQLLDDRQTFKV